MLFRGIYGHEEPIAFLRKSLEGNRVAQGYLFHGLAGVGKKATALAFAKALNCLGTEGEQGEPCTSCRKIDSGNHPDLLELSPDGLFIKIADIRDLTRRMSFRPLEARRRVVIIDEAHSMNEAAANALLKTLEEPAPGNVLILVTHRHDGLPATIRSRCRTIRFAPLPVPVVEQFLRDRGGMDSEDSSTRAAASGGSIGRALTCNPDRARRFKEEVIPVMGRDSWIVADNPLAPFAAVEGFGEDRADVEERLELLEEWFRDVMVYRETGGAVPVMHRDMLEMTRASARSLPRRAVLERIEAVRAARRAIWRNGNRQLVLESMMFTFLSPATEGLAKKAQRG